MARLQHLIIHFSKELNAALCERSIQPPIHMFDYFAREFCPLPSRAIRKVVLELCLSENTEDVQLDILVVKRAISLHVLTTMCDRERNAHLLEKVISEMSLLGKQFGWGTETVLHIGQKLKDRDFIFRGKWKVSKRSPDRRRAAHLWVEYPSTIDIYLVIEESSGAEQRVLVCKGTSGFAFVSAACAELQWIDSARVKIIQDNGRDYWIYDCSAGQLEFHYPRAETGDPHGEYDFACLLLDGRFVKQDRQAALAWLQRSAAKGFKHAMNLLKRLELSDPETFHSEVP